MVKTQKKWELSKWQIHKKIKAEKDNSEKYRNKAAVSLYVVQAQYEHSTATNTHLQYHHA